MGDFGLGTNSRAGDQRGRHEKNMKHHQRQRMSNSTLIGMLNRRRSAALEPIMSRSIRRVESGMFSLSKNRVEKFRTAHNDCTSWSKDLCLVVSALFWGGGDPMARPRGLER